VGIFKWEVDLSKLAFSEIKLPLCFNWVSPH